MQDFIWIILAVVTIIVCAVTFWLATLLIEGRSVHDGKRLGIAFLISGIVFVYMTFVNGAIEGIPGLAGVGPYILYLMSMALVKALLDTDWTHSIWIAFIGIVVFLVIVNIISLVAGVQVTTWSP